MKGQGDKEQLIASRSFLLILSNFKMSKCLKDSSFSFTKELCVTALNVLHSGTGF